MIVMICSTFPFMGGESFLINEIIYFSKRNDKMIIYPIEKKSDELMIELPDNVCVRTVNNTCGIKTVLSAIFSIHMLRELWFLMRHNFSVKKLAAAIRYQIKIKSLYSSIYEDISTQTSNGERICFYSYWMHIHASIASRLKKMFSNSKFVTRGHGYDIYEFRANSGYLPERKIIFDSADIIEPVSNCGLEYLINNYSWIDNNKIQVSYLGTFDGGLNICDNSIRLVSCSNLIPLKRVELLIDALSYIENIQIEWLHFGEGPLREQLEMRCKSKLKDNICYEFKGFVDNEELLRIYKNTPFTLFIHASETEGLPVSFMEAMSFGIPVLCTDVGGCSEIVKNGINGILVDKNITAIDLSKKIIDYISSDESIQMHYRKNARSTWEEQFNAFVNYEKFYNSLMG